MKNEKVIDELKDLLTEIKQKVDEQESIIKDYLTGEKRLIDQLRATHKNVIHESNLLKEEKRKEVSDTLKNIRDKFEIGKRKY